MKEQGYRRSVNDLKYSKDLVLKLEYKDDLVNKAFSTPLLTNCSSKGYSKDGNGATTL